MKIWHRAGGVAEAVSTTHSLGEPEYVAARELYEPTFQLAIKRPPTLTVVSLGGPGVEPPLELALPLLADRVAPLAAWLFCRRDLDLLVVPVFVAHHACPSRLPFGCAGASILT